MSAAVPQSFYALRAPTKKGEIDFSEFKGKVVLIVNIASNCGFTYQNTGLEALYQKYKDRGLVVCGFPCNQFGGQEPGNDDEIVTQCQLNYGVTFPLAKKGDVNGPNAQPTFEFLKEKTPRFFGLYSNITWNYEKFLIDREGNVASRWNSTYKPESLEAEIEKLLGPA